MSDAPIVMERTFNVKSDVIWKALTDQNEMKKWYFDIADFKPVVGHEFEFTAMGEDGTTAYVHLCQVKEVIEGKKLSYSWRYKDHVGDSLLSFDLEEVDGGSKTKLTLTHAGLETFRGDIYPAYAKKNFIQGWTYFIEEGLQKYLDTLASA